MIYLDNAATTHPEPEVIEAVAAAMASGTGNASAIHRAGVQASLLVERARVTIAARLGADPAGLLFTSGGTEANNLAILGVAQAGGRARGHLLCSAIEHPSVRQPLEQLARQGFDLEILPVDSTGRLAPDTLHHALRPDTVLVSVIHGSNELGTVQDAASIAAICAEARVPMHLDACQSYTRVPLDLGAVQADLVSINAHKIHGPQGVGALWVRPGTALDPVVHGGGQERGLRPGTLNTAGIAGFAAAVALATPARTAQVTALRAHLVAGLRERLPWARIHGPREGTLPHVLSVAFPGAMGKDLFMALNRRGFLVSLGSACSAGSTAPSAVLTAAGVSPALARATLRISPSHHTTRADLEALLDALVELTQPGAAPA
ncbi:MAG: cysteine desulfurase family protein [Pseudomonadota bacterium]